MELFNLDEESQKNELAKKIKSLSKKIRRYQKSYYNGEAEISDQAFDALWDELKSLDPQNEIFSKVGKDSSAAFSKAQHIMPMGSQEKAANPEAFLAWAKKRNIQEFLVEYKLDGASLELQYENGNLIRAVTRGDGTIGDDITKNAKKMRGVLHELFLSEDGTKKKINFSGAIRGEVIMTREIHKKKYFSKANCRNAANGLMKRKDGAGSEDLCLIVYDAFCKDFSAAPFSNEEEKILWLKNLGFETARLEIFSDAQSVIFYREEISKLRKKIPYDIDGLVVKERKIDLTDAMRVRPERQIAFKFSLEEAISVLRSVEWSKNGGTYTPVAVFDEVELNGTRVKRASLSNPDKMRSLGVQIGSRILIVKRGEIIPKIERVLDDENFFENQSVERFKPTNQSKVEKSKIVFPKNCEVCGTELVDDGSRLFCPNKNCPKRVLHQIKKWQAIVDIRDFGETLIERLFLDKKILSISDIYKLEKKDFVPYFLNEESIESGKESLGAEKVWAAIHSRKKMSLVTFVAAFDIEGFGETMMEKLVAAGFNTLEKLLSAREEEIAAVPDFAEVSAKSLVAGLAENSLEMKKLLDEKIILLENSSGQLFGKSFCFTGELSIKRADAEKIVKNAGGSVKNSVTRDLSFLVTNNTESGSSKNIKAKKLGVPVINEKKFLEMTKGA